MKKLIAITLFLFCLHGTALAYDRVSPVVVAVNKVSPAVVNISIEDTVQVRSNPFSMFGRDPFFDNFFKDFFEPGFERKYKRRSLGSGVIIDGDRGYILTNSHVVSKTAAITVVLKDKRKFKAEIIGADPDSDLAILKIDSKKKLPAVKTGSSDDLMIGETVIAIGNPFGFSNTVTTGVISALNRSVKTEQRVYQNFIQTDASINPGNSGGPLLNINGEVIGINTAIYKKAQGIGFAIPINRAEKIVADLIRYGEVVPVWTGLVVQSIDSALADYLGVPENKGVLVKMVEKGSPAARAGARSGDVITAAGAAAVWSEADYHSSMNEYAAGDTIKLTLLRNGRRISLSFTARVFPENMARQLAYDLLGIKVVKSRRTKGVSIARIKSGSRLAAIGAKPGDVIRRINEVAINGVKDFNGAVIKYRLRSSVIVVIQRNSRLYQVTVSQQR